MRALSLNCHGLRNQVTVSELHDLVKSEVPKIVFLMETRLPVRKLEFLRVKLGMHGCFGVDRRHFGRGLALLWDSSITLHMQSYSRSHINGYVIQSDGLSWRFTRFYGHLEVALRNRSWALLWRLQMLSNLPWLLACDFNEIVELGEKHGRKDRCLSQMTAFRDALADCSLMDLGYLGPPLTWSNRREEDELVRVVVWRLLHGGIYFRILLFIMWWWLIRIIWVCWWTWNLVQVGLGGGSVACFRFEHVWVHKEGCEDVISGAWLTNSSGISGTPMYCHV
jgi:hypothetical protein